MIKLKHKESSILVHYDKKRIKCRSVILKNGLRYIYCYDNSNNKETLLSIKVC